MLTVLTTCNAAAVQAQDTTLSSYDFEHRTVEQQSAAKVSSSGTASLLLLLSVA
jgi:hypothetical protein